MGLGGPQEYKPVGGNLIRETFMLMVESPFEYDQELFFQKNMIMAKRKLNLFNLVYGQSQGRFLNYNKSYFFSFTCRHRQEDVYTSVCMSIRSKERNKMM